MDKKAQLRRRDSYSVLVAAERCARLIDAHESGRSGPDELRQEDNRFPLWDDISERWMIDGQERWHGWQVKRQRTTLESKVLAEMLQALHDSQLGRGHLALHSLVQIRGLGPLSELEELCEAAREPGLETSAFLAQLTTAEERWVEFTREHLGLARSEDALLFLRRLEVHLLGNERSLRESTRIRLQQFEDPQAVMEGLIAFLSQHPGGAIAIRYEVLAREVLQSRARRAIRAQGPGRMREEYLEAVLQSYSELSPLGPLGEDTSAWPRMEDVYVLPGLKTSHGLERSTPSNERIGAAPDAEPNRRSLPPRKEGALADVLGATPETVQLLEWLRSPVRLQGRPVFSVEGEVGAGKSMLLAHTRWVLAGDALRDPTFPAPVLLVAADLASGDLEEAFLRRAPGFRDARLLSSHCIFLVDGLDEVAAADAPVITSRLRELIRSPRTAAVVVAGRPSRPLPFPAQSTPLKLSPWTRSQLDQFLERWRVHAPEQVAALEKMSRLDALLPLLSNPLTATFCLLLASRDPECLRSRAALFRGISVRLFQGWIRTRESQLASPPSWKEVSPAFERLALEMLRQGERGLTDRRLRQHLGKWVPDQEEIWLDVAHRKFGLLLRQDDGTSRFVLRGIAEHLAGAALRAQGDDAIVEAAHQPWAEEPVRHAIGLVAELDSPERALGLIKRLQPDKRDVGPRELRALLVAARAALDLGDEATSVADPLGKMLVALLATPDSIWIPGLVAEVVHEMARLGGPCLRAVLTHLEPLLAAPDSHVSWFAAQDIQDWRFWANVLRHEHAQVRYLAVERLATWLEEPSVVSLLAQHLFDSGGFVSEEMAVHVGLLLRGAPRDQPFVRDQLIPHLRMIAAARMQFPSAGAAIALRPGEASLELLAQAFAGLLGNGFRFPPEPLEALASSDEGRAALDAVAPEWRATKKWEPHFLRAPPVGTRRGSSPPIVARSKVIRALSPMLVRMTAAERQALRVRTQELLPVLCERALEQPEPLIDALAPAWSGLGHQDKLLLGQAAVKHPALRQALLASWREAQGDFPINDFLGDALTPLIEQGDEEAARLYARWLPDSHWIRSASGAGADLPSAVVLRHPEVQPVAEALSLKYAAHLSESYVHNNEKVRGWGQVTGYVLRTLRPAWEGNAEVELRLRELVSDEEFHALEPALLAYSVPPSPEWLRHAIRERINGIQRMGPGVQGGPQRRPWQMQYALFGQLQWADHMGILASLRPALERLLTAVPEARYIAAAALIPLVGVDHQEVIAAPIAADWPMGWDEGFNRDEVLGRLVAAAPKAWLARLRTLVPRNAFWLRYSELPILRIARGIFLSKLSPEEREELIGLLRMISPQFPWVGFSPGLSARPADALAKLLYELGLS